MKINTSEYILFSHKGCRIFILVQLKQHFLHPGGAGMEKIRSSLNEKD